MNSSFLSCFLWKVSFCFKHYLPCWKMESMKHKSLPWGLRGMNPGASAPELSKSGASRQADKLRAHCRANYGWYEFWETWCFVEGGHMGASTDGVKLRLTYLTVYQQPHGVLWGKTHKCREDPTDWPAAAPLPIHTVSEAILQCWRSESVWRISRMWSTGLYLICFVH